MKLKCAIVACAVMVTSLFGGEVTTDIDFNTYAGEGTYEGTSLSEYNTAYGYGALTYGIRAYNNIAIGSQVMNRSWFNNYNVAIGDGAMSPSTNMENCIAIGTGALANSRGLTNAVAIGNLIYSDGKGRFELSPRTNLNEGAKPLVWDDGLTKIGGEFAYVYPMMYARMHNKSELGSEVTDSVDITYTFGTIRETGGHNVRITVENRNAFGWPSESVNTWFHNDDDGYIGVDEANSVITLTPHVVNTFAPSQSVVVYYLPHRQDYSGYYWYRRTFTCHWDGRDYESPLVFSVRKEERFSQLYPYTMSQVYGSRLVGESLVSFTNILPHGLGYGNRRVNATFDIPSRKLKDSDALSPATTKYVDGRIPRMVLYPGSTIGSKRLVIFDEYDMPQYEIDVKPYSN